MQLLGRHPFRSQAGFTLLEALVIMAIVLLLLAIPAMIVPGVITAARADSGSSQLLAALRTAREQAVTERRNIIVRFIAPDVLEVWREDLDVTNTGAIIVSGETLLSTTRLEQRMEFVRFNGTVPDTPDGFAPGPAAVSFTGTDPWRFTSEGTLVSQSGDVVNGTVFLGRPNEPLTARAVTLFGATALLREWKWNGGQWYE